MLLLPVSCRLIPPRSLEAQRKPRWPILIADANSAAQVRRAAEQKEIDRLAIGSKRVAAWGREHDNEKQARSMQTRVDKLKKDRTVAAMSGGERARLPFPARSTASDHPR
ncbi:hypothetical protein [Burkholderia cepacia]|uniref:hypothetical protein n=1 Tax=Burkholderia cepacia TaxID=292 RepID=UPI001CF3FD15|nr:hypothetical protein [Burkholderia cepacia]MCA8115888.1 hypothetical protein [Burkholderia cepacia]MCA8395821.1 hypothetical protein [Burkholderia cepacia]